MATTTILNQYGNPAQSDKVIHGASESRYRGPQFRVQNKPLEDLITSRDRDITASLSKRLYLNMGPMKSVVDQKATYSVGSAWMPVYKGPDKEAGQVVTDYLSKVFFKNLDVRGGVYDWHQNLKGVSESIDAEGDHLTLLLDRDGMPKIKTIPASSVRTKGANHLQGGCTVKGGEYDGLRITYGIIYDDDDKAVAYRVSTGYKDDDFEDVPAASVIHEFDPVLSQGGRGLPVATHSLDDLKHMLQSTECERIRQMLLSCIGLIVENQSGGPDLLDPASHMSVNENDKTDTLTAHQATPEVWYAQAGTGEKVTQLKHEAGGDTFESFHDRLIRSFVSGAGWSYSLTWKPTGQGTAERGEILRARKAIEARQKRLNDWALKVVTFAYSLLNRSGILPDLEDPSAWEFTRPPRLTVDDGREHKMMVEGFRMGKYTLTDLLEFEGRTFEEHTDQRIAEEGYRQKKIKEAEDANEGVKIDPRAVVTFQANQPEQVESQEDNEQSN